MVFPLYLCSKEMIRRYSVYLNEIDLTYTQYIVMCFFWERKTSNVKELGKTLLLDPSTLTPLLKKLENKGFITRKKSTIDERYLDIEITKKGMNIRDKALDIPNKIGICLNLTDKEAETLYRLSNKILINIERNDIK